MRQFLRFLLSIGLLFILAGCQSTASKSAETHESTQKTSSSRTVRVIRQQPVRNKLQRKHSAKLIKV